MKKSLLTIITASVLGTSVHAQIAQPANASFENWEMLDGTFTEYPEPVSWNSGNECSNTVDIAVTQSSDAYEGSSSVRMETLEAFGIIKINGVVTTATMICSATSGGQEGGSDYTQEVPDSIVGYFKYAPANNDSAYAQIMFLANNDLDTVSFTRVNFTETVTEWTRFSAPITPITPGETPEKLSLFFNSSWGDGSAGEAEVGSIFFVDAVEFIANTTGIENVYNAEGWNVYPNPAVDNITIEGDVQKGAMVEILDMTGKRVMYVPLNNTKSNIDISELRAGIYLYQIVAADGSVRRTGKLLVANQ